MALVLACGLVWCGWVARGWQMQASTRADDLERAAAAAEVQRLAAKNMTRVANDLSTTQIESVRAAAGMRERLRVAANAAASAVGSGAGCARPGVDSPPAIGLVSPATRERLAQLVDEAEAVAERLRACQAVVGVLAEIGQRQQ